ncbi:ABC transporter ATP-binding protein [Treponema parvum]|uniref:ABC transporter ATP-binding protein n=1 Tax=Treponema parvum TaxID=138851 RepID=A0A975EYX3_9SPIR|nr:ABC transporter ATP-binding protein [Treponema parvum]QTQ11376.1 ABC transporter ATP-binding protein [Treponema parvum]QTQ16682.1 ABC transporter ATP-binding protein [Treponema parvum]
MSLSLSYDKINKIFDKGSHNEVHALKDVSFTVEPGELFCLLGPSGCGKTTLLRSTAGLESITGGHILYGDNDMTSIPPFKRNIGMVFQSFALYPHMSIFENVAYGLRVRKIPNDEIKRKVTEVMELVGLQEELKRNPSPTALSGGQQQRVAIARALVYDPDLLLLDEPLANLDAKLRRYMRAEIRRIQKATNITTLFVTHDQEEAMAIGDRLAVFKKGVVEQIGTSDELYTKPQNAFVANFIGKMNFFHGKLTPNGAVLDYGGIKVDVQKARRYVSSSVSDGADVVVGARPEQLSVSSKKTADSIPGEVKIIQHLGQFVRYEVELPKEISKVPVEVDMPHMESAIRELDTAYVSIKSDLAYLYLHDGEDE